MLAVPGSRACHVLDEQIPQLVGDEHLIVVCVGANDVANVTRRREYAEQLDVILAATSHAPTVLLSLPDLAMADRMAEPLRSIAGRSPAGTTAPAVGSPAEDAHVVCVDIASRPADLSRRRPDGKAAPAPTGSTPAPRATFVGRAHRRRLRHPPRPPDPKHSVPSWTP